MKNTLSAYLKHLRKDRSRQKKLAAVLVCLSVIVAGGTTWALHMTGESQTGEVFCGKEEHVHTEECIQKTLKCGYAQTSADPVSEGANQDAATKTHSHTDDCYGTQRTLTCEKQEHTHSETCYKTETTLVCTAEEHQHDASCYDEGGNLICEKEDHSHSTETCYTVNQVLVCGLDEHTHSEGTCYTEESVLVCGKEEGSPENAAGDQDGTADGTGKDGSEDTAAQTKTEGTHVHTDECYEITYSCGKEAHEHTLSCYSNPEANLETADDWKKTFADVELTGDFATDLVAIAKTQLGYEESADNYQVVLDEDDEETGEKRGYTRYGSWYAARINDESGQVTYEDWDAMFVSFCLNYANITDEMLPYSASAPNWAIRLTDLTLFEPVYVEALDEDGNTILVRSGYTPEPGDLIFFDTDINGEADHVGIVEELEAKEITNDDGTLSYEYIVHTIEGDSANRVAAQTYSLEEGIILGYSSIYSVYLSAVDTGKLEGIRHLTAETEDGASFSAIGEIPEGAVLEVSPLTEEQIAAIQETVSLTGYFYDIKILVDGREFQPTSTIRISVSGLGYDAHETLYVYHLTETDLAGEAAVMEAAEPDEAPEPRGKVEVDTIRPNNTGNRIDFGADGFSYYVVSSSPYAETAATYAEGDISYLKQVTDFSNLSGKTFAIFGNGKSAFMLNGTTTSNGTSCLTGTTTRSVDNAIWTFTTSGNGYRISTTINNTTYYLALASNNNLTLVTSANDASTFTLTDNNNGTIYLTVTTTTTSGPPWSQTTTTTTTYINSYATDTFGGWGSVDGNAVLTLYEVATISPGTYDTEMTVWLHTAEYDETITTKTEIHYSTTVVKSYDGENGHDATLTDAKVYYDTEGNTTYLIPVSYLESAFNFTFDSTQADTYPIVYVPSAYDADSTTSKGAVTPTYMELDGTWYIQVTDTTGAATPRSNIYWINATEATDTVTPASTVINVFDYWVYPDVVNDHDGNNQSLTEGINSQGGLNFVAGNAEVTADGYTGSSNPRTGIVQNKLVDGYPQLTTNNDLGTDGTSLDYLFSPDVTATGKTSYTNVGGLLSVDSSGYYYYNSQERFATLNTETGDFIEYTTPAVSAGGSSPYGQFFPFNTIAEGALNNSLADYMNHYFGVSLTTRFLQQFDGFTTSGGTEHTTFAFTGDDDVWIFIDDVLVADLGGIHDAASVVIDFVTGNVSINGTVTSNLKSLFTAAGVTTDGSDWNGNTFANSSSKAHTLKFYYLERGNTDSNMLLKYNLNDIPATGLFKVDQYGEALSGATFAVYASNASGQYLSDLNGEAVTLPANVEYNGEWDIMSGETVVANALYYGTTDATGEMYFTDKDGMPLPISDLKTMFGDYFLLREVDVPDGYRTVSDDVLLKIENGLLVTAESSYLTGVWSSPNALVTATNTLYVANSNDYSKVSAGTDGSVTYYTPASGSEEGKATGSLFAVVLYKGTQGTADFDTWTPVSGSDVEGYDYVRTGDSDSYSNVADAIKAASTYGTSHVFSYSASGMQVLIEELPGEINQYYTILDNDDEGDANDATYLVAYYYTTIDIATEGWTAVRAENTARVASHASTTVEGDNGFTVQWGATIEVPNTVNVLYFQKADSDGDLLDNAVFALYEAATSGTKGYYVGTGDSGTVYIRLDEDASGGTAYGSAAVYNSSFESPVTGTYTIQSGSIQSGGYITDSGAGTITVTVTDEEGASTTYTITPATNASNQSLVGYTHDVCSTVSEAGTGHFQYLNIGTYFLKEIQAPPGYTLGYVNVPVEVTNETVYANAGSATNGVRVGNGVGYLVKTMDVFASLESIDETLSWIYTHLKVEFENANTGDFETDIDSIFQTYGGWAGTGFDGYGVPNREEKGTSYIPASALADTQTWTGNQGTEESEAMTQYLRYEGDLTTTVDTNSVFDYALYEDTDGQIRGVQSYRLWTDVGWSDLAIFQDYAYGYGTDGTDGASESYTQYTDLSEFSIEEISYLFSSSTFVQVTDAVDVDLTVTKVTTDFEDEDGNTATVYLDGAEFYLQNELDQYYKYTPATETTEEKTEWVDSEDEATKLTTETYFTYTVNGTPTTVKVDTKVSVENGVVTKTYTIGGTAYSLTSYENTGAATFTAADGTTTLTGTLQRSFFKIYNLTEGTYTLTEVGYPTYSLTLGGSTDDNATFKPVGDMTITLASGSYWYYKTTGTQNTIIVPSDDIKSTETVGEKVIPKTFLYRTENGDTVLATVTDTNTKTADGGYTFTFTYEGTPVTNTLYLEESSGFTLEVTGEAATRVFKVDNSGTTAAYYDSTTTAYQGGFRVMNTSEASDATLTLVKVDATADASATSEEAGYNTDKTQFAVTGTDSRLSTHNILTGAQFYLYYKATDSTVEEKYYYSVNDSGTVQWDNNFDNAVKMSVDGNGSLTFNSLNKTNTYYLVECQAPDGYNLLTEELKVSWDANGNLTVTGTSGTYQVETVTTGEGDDAVTTTYLVVYNTGGYELPHTGGAGTYMFTLGGIAILAMLTLVYGCGLRRRRERRAE